MFWVNFSKPSVRNRVLKNKVITRIKEQNSIKRSSFYTKSLLLHLCPSPSTPQPNQLNSTTEILLSA